MMASRCERLMKTRLNVYFSPDLLRRIEELADRKRLSRSSIVEAAVASFLSPDGADQREAAFTRRLDRLSRQFERLERDVGVSVEALALFVRFWLTVTPPMPNDVQAAAQAKGRERYQGYIEALGRRLAKGKGLLQEIPNDIFTPGSNTGAARGDHLAVDGQDTTSPEARGQR
jgi:hypothetical protein